MMWGSYKLFALRDIYRGTLNDQRLQMTNGHELIVVFVFLQHAKTQALLQQRCLKHTATTYKLMPKIAFDYMCPFQQLDFE